MQHLMEELTAIFPTLDRSFVDYFIKGGPKALDFVNKSVKHDPVVHPLVHVHPETGRKALFVDPLRMWSIREVTGEESRTLIDFLHRHVSNPEVQVRMQWKPGTLAIWDNRCTLHRRVDDIADGDKRNLHRVGLIQ